MSDTETSAALSSTAQESPSFLAPLNISMSSYMDIARASVVQVLVTAEDETRCLKVLAEKLDKERIKKAQMEATSSSSAVTMTFPQEISLLVHFSQRGCLFYKAEDLHEFGERAQLYETVDIETARAWTFVRVIDGSTYKYLLQPSVNKQLALERDRVWQYIIVESAIKSRDRVPGPGGNRMVTSIRVLGFPKKELIDKVYGELTQKQSGHLDTLEELRRRNLELAKQANVVSAAERRAEENESALQNGRSSPISNPDEELPSRSPSPEPKAASMSNGPVQPTEDTNRPSTSTGITHLERKERPSMIDLVVRLQLLDADSLPQRHKVDPDASDATAADERAHKRVRNDSDSDAPPEPRSKRRCFAVRRVYECFIRFETVRIPRRRISSVTDGCSGKSDISPSKTTGSTCSTPSKYLNSPQALAEKQAERNMGHSRALASDNVEAPRHGGYSALRYSSDVLANSDDGRATVEPVDELFTSDKKDTTSHSERAPNDTRAQSPPLVDSLDNGGTDAAPVACTAAAAAHNCDGELKPCIELFDDELLKAVVKRTVRGTQLESDVVHRAKERIWRLLDTAVREACAARLEVIRPKCASKNDQESFLIESKDDWRPKVVLQSPLADHGK